jgi:5-hydroxyisourate hydrolase
VARVTTHVIDLVRGRPAAEMRVELHACGAEPPRLLGTSTTNADGRTDPPLADGEGLEPGTYELTFHVGPYFRRCGVPLADPPFLDRIVVRVGIGEPEGRYHIPLLLSPHGYSVYRGA